MAGPVKEYLGELYPVEDIGIGGINGGSLYAENPAIDTIRGPMDTKESPFAKELPQYKWKPLPKGSRVYLGTNGFYIDEKTGAVTNAVTGKTYAKDQYSDYTLRHPEYEEGITDEQLAQTMALKKHILQNKDKYGAGFHEKGGELNEEYFDVTGRPIYRANRGIKTKGFNQYF